MTGRSIEVICAVQTAKHGLVRSVPDDVVAALMLLHHGGLTGWADANCCAGTSGRRLALASVSAYRLGALQSWKGHSIATGRRLTLRYVRHQLGHRA